MDLSERKKKILRIVVDDYIESATPVSSKSITENYLDNISSATIRSELSMLEEMGYLQQIHTSSGRVPTKMAYKFYVDELLKRKQLSKKELDYVKAAFNERVDNLEGIASSVVKVISELTDYTSVAVSSGDSEGIIESIKLLKVKPHTALVLLITSNSFYKDNTITIPEDYTEENIALAESLICKLLVGKSFREVVEIESSIEEEFSQYKELFAEIIRAMKEYKDRSRVLLSGENKILDNPEYNDSLSIRNFLSVVMNKDNLAEILKNKENEIEVSVQIGQEEESLPSDCSVVSASYYANGIKLGTYGVIGPVRMNYEKVVNVLENVGKILESMINKENDDE